MMVLKTGMLVGIVGTEDIGVLIQIRQSSNSCVIKLNNGTLKKNVPLDDVEEARNMTDTKEKKSPIRLGGGAPASNSPSKTPTKLAALSIDTKSTDKLKGALNVGDAVRARCNDGSRWFPGKIIRKHRDGTYDVEYSDGDIEKNMAPADVEAAGKSLDISPPRKPLVKAKFVVEDKVKVRYKGGSKLFNGKISRVRMDGTYDIKYDDGDAELSVAESMIESLKQESDDEGPKQPSKKSSFRLDQNVKARYKRGKKVFPGKIKRVHSDGTYDIRYEDGDEEKRVEAGCIEAVDEKPASDEEKTPKGTSRKPLTVGKKVKARYKKGKRLFPGKVSRVRSDGTYDIVYDDGETEMRVEFSQIEVEEDGDDMFADSDDDKKTSKPEESARKRSYEVGDRVKAYYGKGKKLFPGRIAKVNMNGTYDIKYDDGDSETRVDLSFIEGDENDAPKSLKSASKAPLGVGDSVKARYKGGAKFFNGKITRERMDGTFDIRYEDGDSEERVKAEFIERAGDVDKKIDTKAETKKKKSFEVGDVVNAPFQKGIKLFRGKISRVRSDGTYDVAFDDGDKDLRIPADLIQPEEQKETQDSTPKTNMLKVGDSVKARYKKGKKLFAGKIARVRTDGTYDVEYDDGDVELKVTIDMIEVPESKKKATEDDDKPSGQGLKVGDNVRARYNKGSKFFSGKITEVHRDGTYDVRYDDGDKEKHVEEKNIELVDDRKEPSSKKSPGKLKVGDRVQANYKNGVKLFPGKIARVHSDGTYDVTFDDGDSEKRVPKSRIKTQDTERDESPQRTKTGFSVGDAVKAKYKNGTKYFPGKISRVRSDGTYDVAYDDGDAEPRVDANRILAVEAEKENGVETPRSPKKTIRFEVGDVVKARYKKGTKLFPGKISRVRSDSTYDIKYDDGDVETNVDSSFIEGEEKAASKPKESADEKKKSLAVGDKVTAQYKGGKKSYPGKITKVRLDGTFDVVFDDGDVELRVQRSAIELISSKISKAEAKAGSDKDDLFGDSDDDKTKQSGSKRKMFKVGDIVEANFKQKGKFHRGKIVRVRSDGSYDIDYDVGASEQRVQSSDIKQTSGNQEGSDDDNKKKATKPTRVESSDSDKSTKARKSSKKSKSRSSSEDSESGRIKSKPLKKGTRVTYRKADDSKSRRIGTVRRVHTDGSCDIEYEDGDKSKRVDRKLLVECSDSEDSDSSTDHKKSRIESGPTFRRHERVLANWRRSSKLSKPRMTSKWMKATVLEKNSDGTYTIRYNDGVVEEDTPSDAMKPSFKKKRSNSSDNSDVSDKIRKRKAKRSSSSGIGTESLFLLEQLAMTLFEEGVLKKKPKLVLLRSESDSSSSESSTSSAGSASSSTKSSSRGAIDKVLKKLFDSSTLQNYRQIFTSNDTKDTGKISRSKVISIVEELMTATKSKGGVVGNQMRSDCGTSVNSILTEWFSTHDDLRTHRHFEFKTLMLALAYTKNRVGKVRMEQSVATVLEGRFANYHEHKRQLELWQQKLGYRLFETLQRHFHEHALPNMIPSRIRVSELSVIFEEVSRHSVPNKPLDVYLQQQQLFPHHTLVLPEFLCCYYQLYGSVPEHAMVSGQTLELRPVAFVASCLFSNGDPISKRHGDLVRRLSVGRTHAQMDLILRFRESFESLLSTDSEINSSEEPLLSTSQLSSFAARVAPDPTLLEPAMTLLRKRSAAVSLVEIYGSCGFIIDELTSAPTIRNAIEKMRLRVDLAEIRRIISLIRNVCLKILRFPNNADYWRIRADSSAFQQKIGRFDGATSLLEAVGFVEHQKAHFELRGARNMSGKRVAALNKSTLDTLREKCVELDRELSLFDGVESISSILQRISQARGQEGHCFSLDECQAVLKYLSAYIENVLKNPKDSRCWRIREANSTFHRQIGHLPFCVELMESIGFDLRPSLHGNVFILRGMDSSNPTVDKDASVSASLSNFSFTSVSSHMEWFLWRRKQEIDSLLEDEMRYLHDIVGHQYQSSESMVHEDQTSASTPRDTQDVTLTRLYPYGTNALEAFNSTSIQRRQIEMMKNAFDRMDVDQKGYLVETDLSRVYGAMSTLPVCCRFEAFDIGKDGKVDFEDFVAALGPLLDHSYEINTGKDGEQTATFSGDDSEASLCEQTSLLVGDLRVEISYTEAAVALESILETLQKIIQEPGNQSLWTVSETMSTGKKALRFASGRQLLELAGFRESKDIEEASGRSYVLQPQRVRFKTTSSQSDQPKPLDTATISRIGTIAAMLGGHYRGLKTYSVSDVSGVSRAVSQRSSVPWSRAVQVALKCISNIVSQPDSARFREINTATNTYQNTVSKAKGGLELLIAIGFRETDRGTLVLSSEISLDEIEARRLELEVGLTLLRAKVSDNERLNSSVGVEDNVDDGSRNRTVNKRPMKVNQLSRIRPSTAPTNTWTKASTRHNQRPMTSRQRDPIEGEILSVIARNKANLPQDKKLKTSSREKPTISTSSRNTPAIARRKQMQRRAPTKSSAGGQTVLAADVDAGSDVIAVHKGRFVLRGALIRIGAEIRDLYEERTVVAITSNENSSMFQLDTPLQFFHPAKELVSTVPLQSVEVARRLEAADMQTFAREVLRDIIFNAVLQSTEYNPALAMSITDSNHQGSVKTTVVITFEHLTTISVALPNLRVGPSMRYLANWRSTKAQNNSMMEITRDLPSDRKIQAFWEGLVLQSGRSNEKIRAGDVHSIVRKNAYLSLLLSTAGNKVSDGEFDTKDDDSLLAYEEFKAFFKLPKAMGQAEDDDVELQLPLAYLRKNFQVLMQRPTGTIDGFKSVDSSQLLHRVKKEIHEHPPVVSDDTKENQAALEITLAVCHELQQEFGGHDQIQISWPELVYFVRYNLRLGIPEIFPLRDQSRHLLMVDESSERKEIAEVVSGMHSSHLAVLYFDGIVEIYNLSRSGDAQQESRTQVLFSTTQMENAFVQGWMTDEGGTNSRASSRVHQFKRSAGNSGTLIQLCVWDSVLCVNSSILKEPGSGSIRFFKLARNWLSPLRQVTVQHVSVSISSSESKGSKATRSESKVSSGGVIKTFQVTTNGSKVVFSTGTEAVLWVACTGTGEILASITLTTKVDQCRSLFQVVDEHVPSGGNQTHVYAVVSCKSYQRIGMWILPNGYGMIKALSRTRVFSLDGIKMKTVVQLVVNSGMLLVASKDGSVVVWTTATEQTAPLKRLQIPLIGAELQTICCQTLHQNDRHAFKSLIRVDIVKKIDQWETEVLLKFEASILRFSLYLFEDGEVVRVAISDRFDSRLVSLDDPTFELKMFLDSTSGSDSTAGRICLHKHQILRIVFVALHNSRDGVFAHRSMQRFFEELEARDILWKTRDEMNKFAASYRENGTVELRSFYREGDNEVTELTRPQQIKLSQMPRRSTTDFPTFVVGATVVDKAAKRTKFQAWKLAVHSLVDFDYDLASGQVRRALKLRSSYQVEAERLLRSRKDLALEKDLIAAKEKLYQLVTEVKERIRNVMAFDGRPDVVAENLLEAVNILAIMSLDEQIKSPVECFCLDLFDWQPSVSIEVLMKKLQVEKKYTICFRNWLDCIEEQAAAFGNKDGSITWKQFSLFVRQLQATNVNVVELTALFIDLGLVERLPTFTLQLHQFLAESLPDRPSDLSVETVMDFMLSTRMVVEFMIEYTSFSSFYHAKMTELQSRLSSVKQTTRSDIPPEELYVMQLKMSTWQKELHHLSQVQNQMQSGVCNCGDQGLLEPTTEDIQLLKRMLKTPLPFESPAVSSIALGNRIDTIECCDRVAFEAAGRLNEYDTTDSSFTELSVVYVFLDSDDKHSRREFQQELAFLRKVQHLRVREYFLPICCDLFDTPIFTSANAQMACSGDTDEIRCVITESLSGWTSLSDCVEIMRLDLFPICHWGPVLWSCSVRVLLALLSMQSERFTLRKPIDLEMLLVSPDDGLDFRICSLTGGTFVRFGEDGYDEETIELSMVKTFGEFVFQLLHRCFNEDNCPDVLNQEGENRLRGMRKQLICWMERISSETNIGSSRRSRGTILTDFSTVTQIVACEDASEVEKLCRLALLALQPLESRPRLNSLWKFGGRPQMSTAPRDKKLIAALSRKMMSLVELQSAHCKALKLASLCEGRICEDRHFCRAIESWEALIELLFQSRRGASDKSDTTDRSFEFVANKTIAIDLPAQLCGISLRNFSCHSKSGKKELGRQTIQTLLQRFTTVLQILDSQTSFEELQSTAIIQQFVLQILSSLRSLAVGQMPKGCMNDTATNIHRDVAVSAVLWRLSEPLFKDLLAIENQSSRYPVLLQWLDSRCPSFGHSPAFPVASSTWWNGHTPLLPQLFSICNVEEKHDEELMTAQYLRCIYETKEIEFKLISSVGVPKFRLAAIQQWFGPTFIERKSYHPMVIVRPLVATVWRDISFDRLVCALLRDSDEKIVLGALSILECCTRIFRYDPLRNSRVEVLNDSTEASKQSSLLYSCPERTFAMHLCSQSIVFEVKRVLEKTVRALKVLGESGTSSASRSQHPLVAILCVSMAWLVNCLHGGDISTQFWGTAGIDQLVVGHCRANSLPFVKVKDANMIQQSRQKHRPGNEEKWHVFTSSAARQTSRSRRVCSPFCLLVEEIVAVGSSRCIGLTKTLLLSRTFRDVAAITETNDDTVTTTSEFAWQHDLITSSSFGKVSHAIDLARDISELNGTVVEQVQVIVYSRALFLHHTAVAALTYISAFSQVSREIWSWVESAWRAVALQPKSKIDNLKTAGDVVATGLELLNAIVCHPSLGLDQIVELTTFIGNQEEEPLNILHEVISWILFLPTGVARTDGSSLSELVGNAVSLLTTFVQTRRYDEVALEIVSVCVDIKAVLELLGLAATFSEEATIASIEEKQQLWSMLLFFDSRLITSRILSADFFDLVVFSRLQSLDGDVENQLSQRLEAVMLMEILVHASSRRDRSVNTQMLLGEVCKLLLHHEIITKEAQYVRKANDFRHIDVSKRVMQIICCLCIDFASQNPSRRFLGQLEAAGIPLWVVQFHQRLQPSRTRADLDDIRQLASRVDLFWRDWKGADNERSIVTTRPPVESARKQTGTRKTLTTKTRRVQCEVEANQLSVDNNPQDSLEMKVEPPKEARSPVKSNQLPKSENNVAMIEKDTAMKARPSVVHSLLSIDADSALRLVKKPVARKGARQPMTKQAEDTIEEMLDSDAYSPFPEDSSSDESQPRRPQHSTKHEAGKSRSEAKENKAVRDDSDDDTSSSISSSSRSTQLKRASRRTPSPSVPRDPQQEALRTIFRKYDVDGDGALSFIDLRRALAKQSTTRLSDVEIQRWITEKDRSGRGVVSMDDFLHAFAP